MAVPQLQVDAWLPVPWAEWLGENGRGTERTHVGWDGSNVSYSIVVDNDHVIAAITAILGSAHVDRATGLLSRALPVRHPVFDWMHAQSVEVAHLKWEGKNLSPRGTSSNWKWSILTIRFAALPYAVLSDADLLRVAAGDEKYRFVELREEFSTEAIVNQAGSYVYAEGPVGRSVTFGTSVILPRSVVTLKWFYLPEYPGIFNSSGRLARIEPLVGRVNNGIFLGRPAGTLLLGPPVIEPIPLPIPPTVGLDPASFALGFPPRYFNLTLPLKFYDPPAGGAIRGWNTLPWPATGLSYAVTTPDGSRSLYGTGSFSDLFLMNV